MEIFLSVTKTLRDRIIAIKIFIVYEISFTNFNFIIQISHDKIIGITSIK